MKRYLSITAFGDSPPVDEWECERASRIAKIQGNINLAVEQACGRLKGQK